MCYSLDPKDPIDFSDHKDLILKHLLPLKRSALITFSPQNLNQMNILFVCLGNICRSVTAEEVFRTLANRAGVGDQFTVDSAGMIDYHEGELADSRMRACAQRRGYHLTHRSRPVRKEDFTRFDLIVAMDDNNVRQLHNATPSEEAKQKVVRMADYLTEHPHTFIPDPYYDGPEAFDLVVTLLEDACAELLRKVRETLDK